MFPQLFGKYVLEREIAAGGMARVYLATLRGAVGFEKRLVVKQIRTELASDEAFVMRFVEEAKTAVELSHPNIVPVYELGVEQGVYYIAMELCEGLTLSEVLAETGPLGPAEGAYVGAEICRALDYAHRRVHIVHRDVTPRNVLIDDEGAVRLIDFGIAAPAMREGDPTRTEVFGSPGHMPPEQLSGAELSPATDVFAVGVLLIEAWTGYPPFRRATAKESEHALFVVPARVDVGQPELAPLGALIASSVALDARDRPAAAEHLARPLREFLKSEDSGDIARRLATRVRRARARARSSNPWFTGAAGPEHNSPRGGALRREPAPVGGDALTPSNTSPVTRTFAAREELEVWTRKLSPAPAPLLNTPAATPQSLRAADIAQQREADKSLRESSGKQGRISKPGYELFGLALCAAAFVALAFVSGPRQATSRTLARTSAPSLLLSSSSAPERAAVPGSPAQAVKGLPHAPIVSQGPSPKLTESARTRGATVAPGAVVDALGVLKITADPRASVELSGPHLDQFGQTPMLGLKVAAGRYTVLFRNDTFGAPVSTQVMVVAGGSRSVHADFRSAEPAVSVR